MFINALVITWRECLEALLVVGILLAWANTQANVRLYRRSVLAGVAGGIGVAIAVAATAMAAREFLSGNALDTFQTALLFATWALITQMVLWMHKHARQLKKHLQDQASHASNLLGLACVAGLAVAREGIEMVMFLFGAFIQDQGHAIVNLVGGITAGMALACLTAWLGVRGLRFIRLSWVFRISEGLLLAVAASMLATGIDRVLGRDWLSSLANPVWDTSTWLDDMHGMGRILADCIGYRAQPSMLWVIAFTLYAVLIVWQMRQTPRQA